MSAPNLTTPDAVLAHLREWAVHEAADGRNPDACLLNALLKAAVAVGAVPEPDSEDVYRSCQRYCRYTTSRRICPPCCHDSCPFWRIWEPTRSSSSMTAAMTTLRRYSCRRGRRNRGRAGHVAGSHRLLRGAQPAPVRQETGAEVRLFHAVACRQQDTDRFLLAQSGLGNRGHPARRCFPGRRRP